MDAVYPLMVEAGLESAEGRADWDRFAEWAYWGNPYRGERPAGWIGEQDGRIVAFIACSYMPFRLGSWSGVAGSVGNLCVAPGARGLVGVVFTRDHLRWQDVPVQFGSHFTERSGLLWRGFGARACEESDLAFSACISLRVAVDRRLMSMGSWGRLVCAVGGGTAGVAMARMLGYREARLQKPVFEKTILPRMADVDPGALDALCDAAISGLTATVMRNTAYLEWRYDRHPAATSYRRLAIHDPATGRLAGVAILQKWGDEARLSEFLADPNDIGANRETLATAMATTREWGCRTLSAKSVRPEIVPILRDAGFIETRKSYPQYMIVANGIPMPERLITMFTYGDFKPR